MYSIRPSLSLIVSAEDNARFLMDLPLELEYFKYIAIEQFVV